MLMYREKLNIKTERHSLIFLFTHTGLRMLIYEDATLNHFAKYHV